MFKAKTQQEHVDKDYKKMVKRKTHRVEDALYTSAGLDIVANLDDPCADAFEFDIDGNKYRVVELGLTPRVYVRHNDDWHRVYRPADLRCLGIS